MADVVSVPQVQPVQPVLRFLRIIPGVLLLAAIGYAGKLLEQNVGALANFSRWAFLLTFAGVGLRTNSKEMRKQGLRPFAVGAIGEVAIAVFTLGLIVGASRNFGW
jgi:uncharacterized membrane protein YadS